MNIFIINSIHGLPVTRYVQHLPIETEIGKRRQIDGLLHSYIAAEPHKTVFETSLYTPLTKVIATLIDLGNILRLMTIQFCYYQVIRGGIDLCLRALSRAL